MAKLLKDNGFSLQANAKTLEGGQHPDRDAQFSYLNNQAAEHLDAGQPVISVVRQEKGTGRAVQEQRCRMAPHR
ncbi:putative transposase [marine actinobacterium PHSC20C1]|nr:putative transposase [marine actinobacterium PHSC20C1]